ncbi:hypothetical protein [Aureliella helgolandensis]|nr:hypothetical protein [Aureliella helgolandensis]
MGESTEVIHSVISPSCHVAKRHVAKRNVAANAIDTEVMPMAM